MKYDRIIDYVEQKRLVVTSSTDTSENIVGDENLVSTSAENNVMEVDTIESKNSDFIENNEKDLGKLATDLEQISDSMLMSCKDYFLRSCWL